MNEIEPTCCQAVEVNSQAKCGVCFGTTLFCHYVECLIQYLWYLLLYVLFPVNPAYSICLFYRTHTNMCRQTHQYTWKHVFIQHAVIKSKMYAVLKSNMTMFYTILYYYPVVISILFLRNIFTRLKRRVQRGGYHHEKDKIT